MSSRSSGRGTSMLGLVFLLVGIVGAIGLWVLSTQRASQAVDHFARAAVGCTTTLEFTETGTFYVYEEYLYDERRDGTDSAAGDCGPVAEPGSTFDFVLAQAGTEVEVATDDSIAYDVDGRMGESVARFELDRTGTLTIEVRGPNRGSVAAIGRDPGDGVAALRVAAAVVGLIGIVLGGALLVIAGRRGRGVPDVEDAETPDWDAPATSPVWAPPTVGDLVQGDEEP